MKTLVATLIIYLLVTKRFQTYMALAMTDAKTTADEK